MKKNASRRLFVLVAIALFAGCNKSKPTDSATDAKLTVVPAQVQPVPKEPPQLTPQHRFKTGIREISHVMITDDGTHIAASTDWAAQPTQIEIWSLQPEPKKICDIPGCLIAYSPDGKLVVRQSTDNEVEVVDAVTSKLAYKITEGSDFLAFVSADKFVTVRITSLDDPRSTSVRVRTYNARTGRIGQDFTLSMTSRPKIKGPVNDRRELYFVWDDRVEVCNIETEKMIRKVVLAKTEHKPSPYSLKFSQDGKRIVSDSTVYDGFTGAVLHTFKPDLSGKHLYNGSNLYLKSGMWSSHDYKKSYNGFRVYDIEKDAVVAHLIGDNWNHIISMDAKVMVSMVDRAQSVLIVWDLSQLPK